MKAKTTGAMKAFRAGGLAWALMTTTALSAPASAQTAPPPRFQEVDANGVDLISGRFVFEMVEGSIGSGDGAVSLMRSDRSDYGRLNQWQGALSQSTSGGVTQMVVQFGARTERFTLSGATWTPENANGATLTAGSGTYSYRSADGATVTFGPAGTPSYGPCASSSAPECLLVLSVARPNGTSFNVGWTLGEECLAWDLELQECTNFVVKLRMAGVSSSTGYAFTLNYPSVLITNAAWDDATGATFTNIVTAPPTNPAVTYSAVSGTVEDVTDTGGRTWRITRNGSGLITGLRRPGSSADDIAIAYGTGGIVSSVTRDGVTTSYSRSVSGSTATMTITNALSQATIVVSNLANARIASVTDPLSRTTGFQYDSNARLTRTTRPETDYTQYSYDARGNVTEARQVAKSGSGLADIVTGATFDASCANALTCNQPNSVTDARGHVTDRTYDATHGGLLTVTAPAPSGSGDRPQTRYSYTLTNGEYRPTGVSACATGTASSCLNTAAEARTVIGYDSQGNVTSVERRNGDNTLNATTTATWDAYGDLTTVDGPLSGNADTVRYRYNAARQVVGVVGPDPDGGGSLDHPAIRATYRSDGLPTKVERGIVDSQSDGDWTAFSSLSEAQTDYDSNDRPVVERLVSGSTTHTLTQTSYDGLGRVQCVAQRMNPAEFALLPSDACTLDTPGSHGPDRIARTYHDAAGQATQVRTGFAVSGQEADEASATYTNNGQVATLTDAEGNMTTYEYDGFDRLRNLRMPSPTTDGVSAPTSGTGNDFEQYGYDDAGNVTSRRLRDGSSLGFTYDNLSRLTVKTVPDRAGLDAAHERDVYYSYDLLGRPLSARFDSQSGEGVTNAWDALGRLLSTSTSMGGTTRTLAYQYDAAGNRTRITHPDSHYFRTDYDVLGRPVAIVANGATLMQGFAYNNAGYPVGSSRANGTTLEWGYDGVGRMNLIIHGLAGTGHDATWSHSYDPAGQIGAVTRDNDAYAWGGHYAVSRPYTTNGLNQYSAAGATTFTYDPNGNLVEDGAIDYAYDIENRLVERSGGIVLTYDPLGRLFSVAGGSGTTQFLYDPGSGSGAGSDALVAEYVSGAMTRRYVHNVGMDTPLLSYAGTNLGTPSYLHADGRGSIVAVADPWGAGTINRYDEYGIPASTNTGRFQYTGQIWLPELGMYYYKARVYSPTLGRFLQTDPIGYEGGMNLYAYVRNDPVNLTDPLGLQCDGCDIPVTAHYCPEGTQETSNGGCTQNNKDMVPTLTPTGFVGGSTGAGGGRRPPPPRPPMTPEQRRRCAEIVGAIAGSITTVYIASVETAFAAAGASGLRGVRLGSLVGTPGIVAGVIIGVIVGLATYGSSEGGRRPDITRRCPGA